jgi:hypothetical protein
MKIVAGICLVLFSLGSGVTFAQVPQIDPQILTKPDLAGRVTRVEVASRFVTTIRLPEAVNSVIVGDPSKFQIEHSEREPQLVFVKAISTKPAETNLLISTVKGHQVSLLLVSQGESVPTERARVDFLVKYEPRVDFLVASSGFPFAVVGQTVSLGGSATQALAKPLAGAKLWTADDSPAIQANTPRSNGQNDGLDRLLEQQEKAPLPMLYGEHINLESVEGGRVRAGVSRAIDGGDQVVVLFSVVNPTKRAILLMPPQVQLGGRTVSGKLVHRKKWSTAEQLPILDFRLNRRRLGPGERADGVVLFERPPYKQSNETLLLQVADSGAVDRPALAPIGFGVNTLPEDQNDTGN